MEVKYISYEETNAFSSTILRYINQDDELAPFIHSFPSLQNLREIFFHKKNTCNRKKLVDVLKNQYQTISKPHESVLKNIELLAHENTFTVTTGHQLNIFTGPLYFIFKIVSTINLAKELKQKYPDNHFVPVFWMATEDHDFEEINHTYLSQKKVSWQKESKGFTGRQPLTDFEKTLNQFNELLGNSPRATQLHELFKNSYQSNLNLSQATRILVNELFAKEGLLILDADEITLKEQFAHIIERDIIEKNSFRCINQTIKKLDEIGIKPQVNGREINFFYMLNNVRERIIFEDNLYKILNTEIAFTESQLKLEIQHHPDRFSPNVVMRPLYQETILPNIAYIGGGAEVAYWLQLKSTFDFYGINFPSLILRNSGLIINDKLQHKLQKLHIDLNELFLSTEDLTNSWIKRNTIHDLSLEEEWRSLTCIFEKLKLRAHKIDATLSPSAEAVKIRLKKAIISLEKKMVKAEKRNFSEAIKDIETIKSDLFPHGALQERTENFSSFYLQYGEDLISALLDSFKPLNATFTILH